MDHISLLLTTTVAIALLSGAVGSVAAQDEGNTTINIEQSMESDECEAPSAINDELVLCSSDYEDGTAILRFKADALLRIKLVDSGAFMKGGDVPIRSVTLRPGEVNTVRWDVVEHEGNAGVAVNHKDGIYSVPLEDPFVFVGGPWSATDAQLAAVSGATSVGVVSVIVVLRAVLGRSQEPERVA